MLSLRELAIGFDPAHPDDPGETIYNRFRQDLDCPLIAVVDDDCRPIGLIERNSFLTRLAGQYGRAVFGKRPIAPIMDSAPLLVDADTDAGDFAQYALDGHSGRLLKGFIVVEQGRYLGVGAVIDLLKAGVAERVVTEKRLRGLAENLRKSKLEAERQRRFAEAVIEHIPSLVTVRSATTGRFVLVNKAGAAILGVDRAGIVGKSVDEITPAVLGGQLAHADAVLQNLPPAMRRDLPFERAGSPGGRLLRVAQIPVAMPDGDPLVLTVAEDVTEASRALSRIEQLAHFDVLTRLPNRALFQDRLEAALRAVDRSHAEDAPIEAGLLIIDIDRFKSVNDVFGHSVGDAVLCQVADRIRSVVRADDLPARLGGDEFAVLLRGRDVRAISAAIADRLTEVLSQPFDLASQTVHLGGSAGIAIYPQDARRAEDLIQHADMALYRAKAEGKGVWRRFNPGMQAILRQRGELESALRLALENGELAAHFQPIRNLLLDRVTGFEALIRWNHPKLGPIAPARFIPLAEEIGLIGPLGEWMIHEACMMASRLPDGMTMAVNISAVQFRLKGFVPRVVQALAAAGLAPERLEFEVTESVLMQDEAQVLKSIRSLRDLGVRIALDDFGTGYASLAYLQRFPFDKIKIDKSFTQGLPGDQACCAIITAVTALASQLGMVTTAEGVETAEQLQAVTALGCSEVQGFLIGHPVPDPVALLRPQAMKTSAA